MTRRTWILAAVLTLAAASLRAAEGDTRVFDAGKLPEDSRISKIKTLNDFFPMTPPTSKEAWEHRRKELREQVLVANGLWPMPEKTPLNAVIHGKIDRDEYTIEKVYFASSPGHYVCGNLYRPKGKTGRLPAVPNPHGHWANGRFNDAGEQAAKRDMEQGAEKTIASARYPLQAKCAGLARMGCVVFLYDMVGYADSRQIPHRAGFTDAQAELRLQSFMGLQTWNSIRALDFLLSLPDVDPQRIGVTGASGGGTQTFILCAVDDRPAAAFPAVMVSTAMQGGCVCENCSYLRQDAGNIDLAGLFAPKPLGMSGARDWTIDIETKGLPELKALYKLYGAEDRVMARCFPEFGHNYNQVSREVMYNWFNKHLKLGLLEPVVEKPYQPVQPKELTVFDDQHLPPKDGLDAAGLRVQMTEAANKQVTALLPKAPQSLEEFRRVIGTALRVMIHDRLPSREQVVVQEKGSGPAAIKSLTLGRRGSGEQIPALYAAPPEHNGTVVVWVHPDGKNSLLKDGKLVPAAQEILGKKAAILAPDVFWTGELQVAVVQLNLDAEKLKARKITTKDVQQAIDRSKLIAAPTGTKANDTLFLLSKATAPSTLKSLSDLAIKDVEGKPVLLRGVATLVTKDQLPVNSGYAGYTFGYNRPLLANRVHDVLTAVAAARGLPGTKTVHLAGFEKAGPWVLLARSLCGEAVARTTADMNQFTFDKVGSTDDEMMLPGALKYGGLPALTALAAPAELFLHNHQATHSGLWLEAAYNTAGQPDRLVRERLKVPPEKMVAWLLR